MLAKFFAFFALLALVAADVNPLEAYGYAASELIETVDVTGDGGVQRLVVKKGTGPIAKAGSQIAAHYDGKLLADGKQFDSVRAPLGFWGFFSLLSFAGPSPISILRYLLRSPRSATSPSSSAWAAAR